MNTKLIKGLREVYSKYDAFFIDLWGVIHNGIQIYPGAIDVLENLNKLNKRFVLISNAPRPSKSVEKYLIKLKMDKIFINNLVTSGEAALKTLKNNIYGEKFYHLGPKRDEDLIKGFEKNQTSLDKCDFILCTGLFDDKTNSLNYYENLLKKNTKLKMMCTNPDLIVHRGSKTEYCAGAIAALFEKMGGEVVYFGKPYSEVYNQANKSDKKKIIAIGDNLRTDIKGANNMNYDSLVITSGVHNQEFAKEGIEKVLKNYNVKATFSQSILKW